MKSDVIAVTMGDPAGIGPEVVLRACGAERVGNRGRVVVIGDMAVLEAVSKKLGIDLCLLKIESVDAMPEPGDGIPVIDTGVIDDVSALEIGEVSALGGRAAVSSVEKATELALKKKVSGIATAPIQKEAIRQAGYTSIGHTEMLSKLTGSSRSVTMFTVDKLRIFFHSRHVSLREMIESLSTERITDSIILADTCLRSLGFERRLLALAALNPHASDGGLFGNEEAEILRPALIAAREGGVDIHGPLPADSVFHRALQGEFDAVVSLYHDQGHIAAKTYDFYRTVSVTLGLPFIRTSVDHGTGFDIAWQGRANPVSMEEAILGCFDLVQKYKPIM